MTGKILKTPKLTSSVYNCIYTICLVSLLQRNHCCTDTIMPNAKSPRVRAVPAVTRAIAILRLLSRSHTPQSLKAIAESLDLVPSTALHIVRALVAEDLVQGDPLTKRYRLGFRLLRWHNAPTYDAWRKEVDLVRRQGFSIDRGNYIDGVTIVAVPVLNSRDTITHTLAAVGLGSQLDRITALALAREMRTAAQEVAAQMDPQL